MQIINISEAKSTLSKLIERVMNGEEIIIGKAGKPVAKIVPFDINTQPRVLGSGPAGQWKDDEFWMAADFDVLPDDMIELFYEGENADEELPA